MVYSHVVAAGPTRNDEVSDVELHHDGSEEFDPAMLLDALDVLSDDDLFQTGTLTRRHPDEADTPTNPVEHLSSPWTIGNLAASQNDRNNGEHDEDYNGDDEVIIALSEASDPTDWKKQIALGLKALNLSAAIVVCDRASGWSLDVTSSCVCARR